MKREKVIISRKAQISIKEIHDYLKKEVSSETAKKVKDSIINKCKDLKDFASYRKERFLEELDGDYRSVQQWNYIIIFSLTDTEVMVLNVIHASMHPEKRSEF